MASVTGRPIRRLRRLGWGVADQAASSLGNFTLGISVARTLGASALGTLAVALGVYVIVVQVSRALSTDPLMVRFSSATALRRPDAVAAATGAALLVGALGSVVCAAAGAALAAGGQRDLALALFALAAGLPGLTVQDSWRYVFFSGGQGAKAFGNDLAWTLLLGAALLVGAGGGQSAAAWPVLAYGGTATLAALIGYLQARILPHPSWVRAWISHHRDLNLRFLAENVTLGLYGHARSFLVVGAAGLAAGGALRGSELLIGPVASLLMGVAQVAVPEGVRALETGPAELRRTCIAISAGLSVITLGWGLVLLIAFPHGLGPALLGGVWGPAYELLPATILSFAALCWQVGPAAGLRTLERADLSLRAQIAATAWALVGGACGAGLAGAQGVVWGAALGTVVGSYGWWLQFRRAVGAHGELVPHGTA